MRLLLLVLSLFVGFESALARDDSLERNMAPEFYRKRTEPVVNIALLYYGDYYTPKDLERVQLLLEARFQTATRSLLQIKTVATAILPFKFLLRDHPDYTQPYVTDPDRLQRLWYYDHVGGAVLKEVYEAGKAYEPIRKVMKDLDAILVVTGAQFNALGFASGRVGATENPMEVAWGLPDGGRVEYVTDARVVDELIHELGHTFFLGHTSVQCQKDGMTPEERRKCCLMSPARDDVMSYCRSRARVDTTFMFGFSDCNLENIRKGVVPAMLSGGAWKFSKSKLCD